MFIIIIIIDNWPGWAITRAHFDRPQHVRVHTLTKTKPKTKTLAWSTVNNSPITVIGERPEELYGLFAYTVERGDHLTSHPSRNPNAG